MVKILLPLLLAVVVALLVYFLGPWHGTLGLSGPKSKPIPTGIRVVATQNIPVGTVVTPAMVTLQTVPRPWVTSHDLTALGQAVGQVAQVALMAGETLRGEDVEPPQIGNLVYQVRPGQRAMTISVTDTSGVDFRLLINERVDVMEVKGGNGNASASGPTATATILLKNVRVLALGPPAPTTAQTSLGTGAATNYGSVTLSVTPTQAATLAKAGAQYSLVLLARRVGPNGLARSEYPSSGGQ